MPVPLPERFELDPVLRRQCEDAIREGSKSFLAASLLLPAQIRLATRALYAFCRAADDLVDESGDPADGVAALRARLDAIYAGQPQNDPADLAFHAVARHFDIPRLLPDALIEGFAWDAGGRSYKTLDDVNAYAARVASTVGVMMTLVMGVTDRHILARAGELGVAMQLTNIARDVGEDARRGRIYLPLDWLAEAGVDPEELLANPVVSPGLCAVVERLVETANGYYAKAMTGISGLPFSCRIAIRSAALIYREIGREIERNGFDSISCRAHTSTMRKLELIAYAVYSPTLFSSVSDDAPCPQTLFLIDAAARAKPREPRGFDGKAGRMMEIIALSETRRRKQEVAA
ncbi:MAG: phytoene/squalene synthase family protein [Nitratireductor sp.]|nr:phytoene/squalene synthase family protein [Nitratireductor sp.]